MTDKQINTYFGETANYASPDEFASDVALSLLDPEDPDQEVDTELAAQLRVLWHVARDTYKDFFRLLGLTQTQVSIRFCIPLRTVQRWAAEDNTPPLYVRLMMAEAAGLLHIR